MNFASVPVKLAHVSTVDLSIHFFLLDHLSDLREAGYSVHAVSSPGVFVPSIEQAGTRHFSIRMNRKTDPARDLLALAQLVKLFRRESFSIVHTHTPKAGVLGRIAAKLAGTPVILHTLHGLYFDSARNSLERRILEWSETVACRSCDRILSVNHEDIAFMEDHGICRPGQAETVVNGIDVEFFDSNRVSDEQVSTMKNALGIGEDERVIGFVGRLAGHRKGVFDLLSAAKIVQREIPNVRFLFVGSTDAGQPDAVDESIAAEYGVSETCIFAGSRDRHELRTIFKLFDVHVLPSLFEGMPRNVMEATAMAIPSIVSDVRGNREAVANDETGVVVPFGDVNVLASEIIRLLKEEDTRRRLASYCRPFAEQNFDQRIGMQKVRRVYSELLREKGLPVPEPVEAPEPAGVGSDE
jgi:glycosyltransferase involved in cell wall biosynthesis